MSRSLRRGAVAAIIIATAPILTACSDGSGAATLQVAPDNAEASVSHGASSLKLDQITVVTSPNGQAPANIMVNIANNGTTADTLTSVTVDDSTQAVLSGPATIPVGGALLLSGPGQTSATVPTLDEAPGQNAEVTFTFTNAGSVTVQGLVAAGTGQFSSFAPAAPSAAPTPSASKSAASGDSASGGSSTGGSTSGGSSTSGSTSGSTNGSTGANASSSASPSTGTNG